MSRQTASLGHLDVLNKGSHTAFEKYQVVRIDEPSEFGTGRKKILMVRFQHSHDMSFKKPTVIVIHLPNLMRIEQKPAKIE
jgi:hypothetical protein